MSIRAKNRGFRWIYPISFAIVGSSSDQGIRHPLMGLSVCHGRVGRALACYVVLWGFNMRRFVLPNLTELSILATLAVLAATIVGTFAQPQVAIITVGFPIVLVGMLMGARRTGQLDAAPNAAPIMTTAPEAEQSA